MKWLAAITNSSRTRSWLTATLVFLFPLLYYFRFVYPNTGLLFIDNDFVYLYYSYKGYLLDSIAHGNFPWWSPAESTGYAFFGNPFAAPVYPVNVLLLLVRLLARQYNVWFHNIFTVLGACWFALGIYRWLRASFEQPFAAVFASIAVATCWAVGYFMRFPNAIHVLAWCPWVLGALRAAHFGARPRTIYWGVFAVLCQLTAGYPYFVVYSFLLYAGYVAYLHGETGKDGRRARLARQILMLIIPVLVTLPYTSSISQLMAITSDRAGNNFTYATEWGYGPLDFLGSLVFPPVASVESCFYLGTLPLFLAVFYFSRGENAREKLALVLGAIFVLAVSLGFRSYLFTVIWSFTPVIDQMRVFSRMPIILLPLLAVAIHQGYQLFADDLHRPSPERTTRSLVWIVFGFILVTQFLLLLIPHPGTDYSYHTAPRLPGGSNERDFVVTCILTLWAVLFVTKVQWLKLQRGRWALLGALLVATTLDTGTQGRFLWTHSATQDVPPAVEKQSWFSRLRSTLRPKSDFHHLVRDYFTLDRVANPSGLIIGNSGELSPVALTRGVTPNFDYESYAQFLKREAGDPAQLDRLLGKQKLFFHTEQHQSVATFLKDVDAHAKSAAAPVVKSFDGSTLTLQIDTTAPGYLTWIDNWDLGWKARVDDAPAPVEKIMGTFKAVRLAKAGSHVVRFAYRPIVKVTSWIAFALGLLLLIGLRFPPLRNWLRLATRASGRASMATP